MTVEIAMLLSDNLDLWTTAVERKSSAGRGGGKRISLYGIDRLRALLLDLAVRGKLVPQDSNEEPASALLKRIGKEKAQRVFSGEMRKPRELDNGDDLMVPFSIPETWKWVRLDEIGAIIGGGTPPAGSAANFVEGGQGIPWLTPADLGGYKERFISHGARDLTEAALRASSATVMPAGSVLFTSRAPIGYVVIAANPISTNQGFKSIVPYIAECSLFIATTMKSFAKSINENAPGTTFKEVSGKMVAALPFPLPPLAEQQRIVAKLDELMALCNALEAESAAAMAAHQTLVEVLLATLIASTDAADLAINWTRLETHFDTLFTTEASVDALKQTILELAVSGRLVEGLASVKQGTLGDVGDWVGGNGFPKQYQGNSTGEVPFLKVSDMNLPGNEREITVANNWVSSEALKSMKARAHPAGTIIFPKIGGAIATNKRRILSISAAIDNNCAGQVPAKGINIDWLFMVLSSIDMAQYQAGTSVPALNMRQLAKHAIAIPDEAAQKVIVERVHDLMSLCDLLAARLAGSVETQRHLADTIVELAVA